MSYETPENPALWWSAKVKTAPPLRLEDLQREMQRVTICALCGRNLGRAPAIHVDNRNLAHKVCPP